MNDSCNDESATLYALTMHCTSMAIYALGKEAQGCTVYSINPITLKYSRCKACRLQLINRARKAYFRYLLTYILYNGSNAKWTVHLPVYQTKLTFLEEWHTWLCWIFYFSYWPCVCSMLVLSDSTQLYSQITIISWCFVRLTSLGQNSSFSHPAWKSQSYKSGHFFCWY
jgi:hypothetical protein